MGKGLVCSALLHGFVVLFAWVGMPFFARKDVVTDSPIVVELVTIDEMTAAPPPEPEPEPEPEPAPEPPPEPEPAPAPEPPPPEPAPAPPPPPPPPEPAPAPPPPEPEPEQIAEAPPVQKVAAPPRKPQPPPKDTFDQLVSLVKDLEQEVANRPDPVEPPPEPQQTDEQMRTRQMADRATISERDAIRAHIEQRCWTIDGGVEGVQNLSASLRVSINPDGSVRRVTIEDTARYFIDSNFQSFADDLRRDILSCSNIPISPQRYEIFKEMILTFTPQGRVN